MSVTTNRHTWEPLLKKWQLFIFGMVLFRGEKADLRVFMCDMSALLDTCHRNEYFQCHGKTAACRWHMGTLFLWPGMVKIISRGSNLLTEIVGA